MKCRKCKGEIYGCAKPLCEKCMEYRFFKEYCQLLLDNGANPLDFGFDPYEDIILQQKDIFKEME